MSPDANRAPELSRQKRDQVRRILDTPRDEAFDRLTRLAAATVGAPVSLITFIDSGRQWFKSSYGLREPWSSRRETPLSHSFCQHVVARERPLIVADARQEPLVQENLAIPEIGVVAYLGVPLVDHSNVVLGSFAVIDERPREWTEAEVAIVQDFAAIAATEVELKTESALRGEAEAALRQAQKMEALGRLASGIAHDFGNLLTIFHGNCDLLLRDPERSAPWWAEIEAMKETAVRASLLVGQLLTFGQRKVLERRAIDCGELIQAIEPLLRRLLPSNITFAVECDSALEPVFADQSELEQILVNLVVNARDAMPGGGEIRIQCWSDGSEEPGLEDPGDEHRSYTWLSVTDTGAGMDAETRERIFEPFFTTKKGMNSGLGLSTVYGVVHQLGGQLTVDSEPGRGTRFAIGLPACDATCPPDEASANRADFSGSERILVVEDQAPVRATVEKILAHWGYEVIAAAGLEGAIAAWHAAGGRLDLLVTDVVLAEASGVEVAERLRKLEPELPVLYLSGHAGEATVGRLEANGAALLLEKPFSLMSLGRKVREVLDGAPG